MAEPFQLVTQPESWRQEVSDDVVQALRRLLERAEAGELQGVAYSCITIDGCVVTGFTKSADQSATIGGLERVKFRMLSGED